MRVNDKPEKREGGLFRNDSVVSGFILRTSCTVMSGEESSYFYAEDDVYIFIDSGLVHSTEGVTAKFPVTKIHLDRVIFL